MTQKIEQERFEEWWNRRHSQYTVFLRKDNAGEYIYLHAALAWKAWQEALASHAPRDLNCKDIVVAYWMTRATTAELKGQEFTKLLVGAPSEAAAQPTKRQQIDALVKAEYEDGLYDRLPEIEHNDHQPTPVHQPEEK